MMSNLPLRTIPLFLSVSLVAPPLLGQTRGVAAADLPGLSAEARNDLKLLARPDADHGAPAARRKAVRRLLATPRAHKPLARVLDEKLATLERGLAQILDQPIREAYHRRLQGLSAQEIRFVARTRRIWRNYLEKTSTQLHFQKHFLQPAAEVGKLLIPDAAKIRSKRADAQRQRMREFNGYRDAVRKALGLGADPTTGVLASTGIPLPPLFQVRSYDEHLEHLHRTIAVANSVAPFEARNILLHNAAKARFIDFQEAEFVLFANEIRMLMGTIAWATDTAACAATRDHSKDRVDGKAKGHWSSIPGKKGFTHRLRRFGTRGSSEGAGGGSDGRAYLRNLSYGGGHTGPLYSSKRNVVGVGRHGNTYTSTYATNREAIHSAPLFEAELFMPPGIPQSEVLHSELRAVCNGIKVEEYDRAQELLAAARVATPMEKFLKRYLGIAIQVEADWRLECLARVEAVGDLYGVQQRLDAARKVFGSSLDKRLAPFAKRLKTKAAAAVLAAGRAYALACTAKDRARMRAVIEEHPGTVYAQAAKDYLASKDQKRHPLSWFLTRDGELNRFEYLTR